MLNCWIVSAQQFSFPIETKGFSSSETIYLKKYVGREELTIDSVVGSGEFVFTATSEASVSGLYIITASRSEIAELIINPTEKTLQIVVEKEQMKKGGISIFNSEENNAYSDFVEEYLKYEQAFYSLADLRFDKYAPKIISELEVQTKEMEQLQKDFNAQLQTIREKYPKTYTAQTLCPLAERPLRNAAQMKQYDTYPSFLKDHFWTAKALENDLILNHFLLNEGIKNYFRFFIPKNETAIKEGVDVLLKACGENEVVGSYVRSFLIRNFLRSNAQELSLYVKQTSGGESCDLNLTQEELDLLQLLDAKLDTGSIVPNVSLPNLNQQTRALKDIYAANAITIVVFWSANCVHCQEELPFLYDLYRSYKDKGVAVYAINLDENKFLWRDYLAENKFDWVNVSDIGQLSQSEIIKQFHVYRTPSIFVVDGKGKIFAKDIFGDDLQLLVDGLLKNK
ncbi:MAG: AhpC/TSA family protein [Flavobacteriales bacterium]|nr:AhpC/TSA family protein [Flavobacteriales bacterium]